MRGNHAHRGRTRRKFLRGPGAVLYCSLQYRQSGRRQNTSVCPNQIFDPTTRHVVNGTPVESPFPNNTIPKSMLDPTALLIQNMFPQPNNPAGAFSTIAVPGYGDYRHTTIPSIKIDQLISSKLKLSGYYSATKTFSPQTNGFPHRSVSRRSKTLWRRPYALTWTTP